MKSVGKDNHDSTAGPALLFTPAGPVQAMKSAGEEYSRIMDIVGRYAILHPGVAFTCKRQVSGSYMSLRLSWGPGLAPLGISNVH